MSMCSLPLMDFPCLISWASPTVLVEADCCDDGDSECDSSPRGELDVLQPSTQPRREDPQQRWFCPYFSHNVEHVTVHEKIHKGEKPSRCTVCEKAFLQSGHLRSHMKTHTGNKSFRCPVCRRVFAESKYLQIHMRTHTNERPFRCEVCQKAFSQSGNLVSHKRVHTGEKPYQCSTCERAFAQKSTLLRHEKTHNGERKHLSGDNLSRHQKDMLE
uniref:Putative ovo n=1 Tax=Ixodes ricinus TaxID=34613 RepID=A0A6B0V272_IXORI